MTSKEKQAVIAKIKIREMTPDELNEVYKAWDYKYKPSSSCFLHTAMEVACCQKDFVDYMILIRNKAYYTQSQGIADMNFNVLACLIHIATIEQIETPFDSVIKSDKDFEFKLNHLYYEK